MLIYQNWVEIVPIFNDDFSSVDKTNRGKKFNTKTVGWWWCDKSAAAEHNHDFTHPEAAHGFAHVLRVILAPTQGRKGVGTKDKT